MILIVQGILKTISTNANYKQCRNYSISMDYNENVVIDLFDNQLYNISFHNQSKYLNITNQMPFKQNLLSQLDSNGENVLDFFIFQPKINQILDSNKPNNIYVTLFLSNLSLANILLQTQQYSTLEQGKIMSYQVQDFSAYLTQNCKFVSSEEINFTNLTMSCRDYQNFVYLNHFKVNYRDYIYSLSFIEQINFFMPSQVGNYILNCNNLNIVIINPTYLQRRLLMYCTYTEKFLDNSLFIFYEGDSASDQFQLGFNNIPTTQFYFQNNMTLPIGQNQIQKIIPLNNIYQDYLVLDYSQGAFLIEFNIKTVNFKVKTNFSNNYIHENFQNYTQIAYSSISIAPQLNGLSQSNYLFVKNLTVLSDENYLYVYYFDKSNFYFTQKIKLIINQQDNQTEIQKLYVTQDSILVLQILAQQKIITYYKLREIQQMVQQFQLISQTFYDLSNGQNLFLFPIPQIFSQYGNWAQQSYLAFQLLEVRINDSNFQISLQLIQKNFLQINYQNNFTQKINQIQSEYVGYNTPLCQNKNSFFIFTIIFPNFQQCIIKSNKTKIQTLQKFYPHKILQKHFNCGSKIFYQELDQTNNQANSILTSQNQFLSVLISEGYKNFNLLSGLDSSFNADHTTLQQNFILFAQKIQNNSIYQMSKQSIRPLAIFLATYTFQCFFNQIIEQQFWCDYLSGIQIDTKELGTELLQIHQKTTFNIQLDDINFRQYGQQNLSKSYVGIYKYSDKNQSFQIEYRDPYFANIDTFRLSQISYATIEDKNNLKFFGCGIVTDMDFIFILENSTLFQIIPSQNIKFQLTSNNQTIIAFDSLLSKNLKYSKILSRDQQLYQYGDQFILISISINPNQVLFGLFMSYVLNDQLAYNFSWITSINIQYNLEQSYIQFISSNRFVIICQQQIIEYMIQYSFGESPDIILYQPQPSIIQLQIIPLGQQNLNFSQIVISKYYMYIPLQNNQAIFEIFPYDQEEIKNQKIILIKMLNNISIISISSLNNIQDDILLIKNLTSEQLNFVQFNELLSQQLMSEKQIQTNEITFFFQSLSIQHISKISIVIEILKQLNNFNLISAQNIQISNSQLNKTQNCYNISQYHQFCQYQYNFPLSNPNNNFICLIEQNTQFTNSYVQFFQNENRNLLSRNILNLKYTQVLPNYIYQKQVQNFFNNYNTFQSYWSNQLKYNQIYGQVYYGFQIYYFFNSKQEQIFFIAAETKLSQSSQQILMYNETQLTNLCNTTPFSNQFCYSALNFYDHINQLFYQATIQQVNGSILYIKFFKSNVSVPIPFYYQEIFSEELLFKSAGTNLVICNKQLGSLALYSLNLTNNNLNIIKEFQNILVTDIILDNDFNNSLLTILDQNLNLMIYSIDQNQNIGILINISLITFQQYQFTDLDLLQKNNLYQVYINTYENSLYLFEIQSSINYQQFIYDIFPYSNCISYNKFYSSLLVFGDYIYRRCYQQQQQEEFLLIYNTKYNNYNNLIYFIGESQHYKVDLTNSSSTKRIQGFSANENCLFIIFNFQIYQYSIQLSNFLDQQLYIEFNTSQIDLIKVQNPEQNFAQFHSKIFFANYSTRQITQQTIILNISLFEINQNIYNKLAWYFILLIILFSLSIILIIFRIIYKRYQHRKARRSSFQKLLMEKII